MLINLRNALMAGKRLPYDAEVEYLESTGTQWINTGITPTISDTTRIVADLSLTSINTSDNNIVFGNYAISPAVRQFAFVDTSAKARIAYVGASSGSATIAANSDYLFEAQFAPGNSYLKVNGATSSQNTSTATALPSWPLSLFACRFEDGVISPSSMRHRSCKIYLNGVLVRDYIPVRKGTVGYLYDRVSGKLFGNAGTGDFVLGPDVVPVEWVCMGDGQYTLFDYTPSADTSCEVKIRPIILNPKNGSRGVFGSEIANNNKSFLVMFENDQWATNLLQFRFGTYLNETDVTQFEAGNLYSIKLNSSGGFVDGIKVVNTKTATPSGSTQTKFGIGCYIRGGNVFSTLGTYDYYGLTIEDGVFSANFRPVRVGTDATSWEGAMIDTLTRRIYRNAGTGAFTYGNDLKYPIPAE